MNHKIIHLFIQCKYNIFCVKEINGRMKDDATEGKPTETFYKTINLNSKWQTGL